MTAIPVVLCGKSPQMASGFVEAMKPEFDVTHVLHNLHTARNELPTLFTSEPLKPSSKLGSNANNASLTLSGNHPRPRAVVVGKGFSEEELEALKSELNGAPVAWLYPDDDSVPPENVRQGGGEELVRWVAERAKKCMQGKGVKGEGDVVGKGEVWKY